MHSYHFSVIRLLAHVYVCVCILCPVRLFVTPWTIAHQAPLSMGFPRQEYRVGCHFLLQGIFPTQGLNPSLSCLLHWQVGSLLAEPPGKPLYASCFLTSLKVRDVLSLYLCTVVFLGDTDFMEVGMGERTVKNLTCRGSLASTGTQT